MTRRRFVRRRPAPALPGGRPRVKRQVVAAEHVKRGQRRRQQRQPPQQAARNRQPRPEHQPVERPPAGSRPWNRSPRRREIRRWPPPPAQRPIGCEAAPRARPPMLRRSWASPGSAARRVSPPLPLGEGARAIQHPVHGVDDRAGGKEEAGLEAGVGHQVEHRRPVRPHPQRQEHEPELADGGVGQHLLDVLLDHRQQRAQQRGQHAGHRHHRHHLGRQQRTGTTAGRQVHARGHHGGGVDQGRDRAWARPWRRAARCKAGSAPTCRSCPGRNPARSAPAAARPTGAIGSTSAGRPRRQADRGPAGPAAPGSSGWRSRPRRIAARQPPRRWPAPSPGAAAPRG